MWMLHSLGTTYGNRPSSYLGIEDEWAAYQLDMVALVIGRMVESKTANGKKSANAVLREMQARMEWKKKSAAQALGAGIYRDPKPFVTKKIKIPANGVW